MFRRKEETEGGSQGDDLMSQSMYSQPSSASPATASTDAPAASGYSSAPSAPPPARAAEAPKAPAAAPAFRQPSAAANRMAPANMAAAPDKGAKGNRRVLTVGNDILLKGEIATCDRLVIEGKVDATLNDVHTVEIAETGSFKGSAQIEDAEISGLFEGELIVRNRLVIYSTGKVRGKITYGEIEIERGGELTGEIKTNTGAGSASKPKAA